MKWIWWQFIFLLVLVAGQGALAGEGAKSFQVSNRLRVEYDDNINQTETEKINSWKVIEEVELLVNFNLQNTYIGIRYRPSYIWWEHRPTDSTDIQNELDFIMNQTFSPRLSLSVIDTLRRGEAPSQKNDEGFVIQKNRDFYYNTLNTTLGYLLAPATRLELAGRYVLLRYDNSSIGDSENFDQFVGGLTLRHQWVPETTLIGELRAEGTDYSGPNRGSKSLYAGGGVEHIFSPNLIGNMIGGYQRKDFDSSDIEADSQPYVNASATFLPSPATRISAGAGYSMYEADVFPFASQDRTQIYAGLAHDLSSRLSIYLNGGYTISSYDTEQAISEPDPTNPTIAAKGADETVLQVSTRATYQLNRSNWLEAGWQYVDFDSKLKYNNGNKIRESYEENRVDVGWKTQF